ncbi:cell envelope integrity protein TolA [Leptothrix discophora]|uniref:Cell envelope integrity protein TolA n=1 Tax=Leptothrix discophora TaxID=89 RepID=A0ABT9G0Q4_LEPDI|nr:cell envelope integrity protein TolA [Leptothrix discophora]MDP4300061.1 cell envelope integrity protein TolA [Leptothrix discophora]
MNTFDALHRPPSPDGMGTGFTLALLVHVGLVAALAYGVAWRRQDVNTVSAELWAAVPQIAAPMASPPPPPPPPAPTPAPAPRPTPAPPPPAPPKAEADIAIRKAEKLKAEKEKAAQERAEKEKAEKEKADKLKAEKLKADKEKADKAEKDKDKARAAKEAADKAARDKVDKAEQERLVRQRQENLARMNRDLGSDNPAVGNNPAPSTGRAAVSAAPSASYAGRIRGRVFPNIIYSGPRDSTMVADVEVKVAPDGKILASRMLKSSGSPEWDQAVLRAITRTDMLPADIDGRVPPVMVLTFDPTQR